MFFLKDPAATEIYTLSLHDALPISLPDRRPRQDGRRWSRVFPRPRRLADQEPGLSDRARGDRDGVERSEEHTSELQSLRHLVCRLLLEKKKIHALLVAH